MKSKIFKISFLALILFIGLTNTTNAIEAPSINLTIRDAGTIIFSGTVPLQPAGNIDLNSHPLDADSVLSIINDADILSSDFSISDLQYYDSYGSFYLKCITSSVGNDCDNWQYTVNDTYPGIGMDKKILSGGENVYVYFGPQYKIQLSSNEINTTDSLTVTTKQYDYQNNAWINRTGATIGLTQPDPNNPFNPTEIQTTAVDGNGQAVFLSIVAGIYNVGVKEDYYFPTESLTVKTPITIGRAGSGGGAILISNPNPAVKAKFDSDKAFDFLVKQQKENGSFDEDLYTDWAAIALSSSTNYKDQKEKLVKYFGDLKITDYQITDYERHAMALMSLGLNPYNINGENYINKIVSSFDGKQFGDTEEDNDDIFALIVLQNSGFILDEKMITDDVDFILSRQKENGSWDESVDMTGAAIESLSAFSPKPGLGESLAKAKTYLKEKQKDTGGWDNVSSTAWAIEGIIALSEKPEDWVKNKNTPIDYLVSNQDIDGGIKDENLKNRIWNTSYVATSLSFKTWNQIMQKFGKPIEIKSLKIVDNKLLEPVVKNTIKKHKIVKNEVPLPQNTASVINSITDSSVQNKEIPKSGWFKNILNKIFSIF